MWSPIRPHLAQSSGRHTLLMQQTDLSADQRNVTGMANSPFMKAFIYAYKLEASRSYHRILYYLPLGGKQQITGRSNINFPGLVTLPAQFPRSASWGNQDFSSVSYINFLVVFFLVVPDPGK